MTPDQFIEAVRRTVLESAVTGTLASLRQPAGRLPRPELLEASRWYLGLPAADRSHLEEVVRMTAHQACFGFLAVLDGVRAVEDTAEKGSFRLTFKKGSREWDLNPPGGQPLHEILNQEA